MKIECGSSSTQFLSAAIFVDTSRTSTTITCDPAMFVTLSSESEASESGASVNKQS